MYLICGKEGISTDPDFQSQTCYYELGWEVNTTHVKVKRLLFEDKIKLDDTIVTLPGREFFYAETFPNVITFEKFCEIKRHKFGVPWQDATAPDVYDVCWEFQQCWGAWPYWYFSGPNQTYDGIGWASIQNVRQSILHDQPSNNGHLCVAVRVRNHESVRNASKDYAKKLLQGLRDVFDLPIFLVGQDLPDYKIEGVHGVCLETWIKLIRDPSCRGVIGSHTGPMGCAGLFAPKGRKIIIAPLQTCISIDGNLPTGMGKCLNLNGNERYWLPIMMPPEEIVEAVTVIVTL